MGDRGDNTTSSSLPEAIPSCAQQLGCGLSGVGVEGGCFPSSRRPPQGALLAVLASSSSLLFSSLLIRTCVLTRRLLIGTSWKTPLRVGWKQTFSCRDALAM